MDVEDAGRGRRRELRERPHERSIGSDLVNHVQIWIGAIDTRDEHRGLTIEVPLRIERDVVPVDQATGGADRVGCAGGGRRELVDHRIQVEEDAGLAGCGIDSVDHAGAIDRIGVLAGTSRDRVNGIAEYAAGPCLDPHDVVAERRGGREHVDAGDRLLGRVGRRGRLRDRDRARSRSRARARAGRERRRERPGHEVGCEQGTLFELVQDFDFDIAAAPRFGVTATRPRSGRLRHSIISFGWTRPSWTEADGSGLAFTGIGATADSD